ncbi:unnamed protein product, partial [Protopolystoma xenopodis]
MPSLNSWKRNCLNRDLNRLLFTATLSLTNGDLARSTSCLSSIVNHSRLITSAIAESSSLFGCCASDTGSLSRQPSVLFDDNLANWLARANSLLQPTKSTDIDIMWTRWMHESPVAASTWLHLGVNQEMEPTARTMASILACTNALDAASSRFAQRLLLREAAALNLLPACSEFNLSQLNGRAVTGQTELISGLPQSLSVAARAPFH